MKFPEIKCFFDADIKILKKWDDQTERKLLKLYFEKIYFFTYSK